MSVTFAVLGRSGHLAKPDRALGDLYGPVFQFCYQSVDSFVDFHQFLNFFNGMDDSAVILAAKGPPQFRIGKAQSLSTEVHGHLPGKDKVCAAFVAQDILWPQIETAGHSA